MSQYTNVHNIPLALAVWLVADDYDYVDKENYISVTTLMKPLRMIILGSRKVTPESPQALPDLSDLAARALGTSLHDSIEKAWKNHYKKSLSILGYSKSVIDAIRINPEPEEIKPGIIPVYFEQRAFKQVGKWTVGGKFDLVAEGIVHDNKSTTSYTWKFGGKEDDYSKQGSLYRWLNPEKITEDFIRINYIFTDWQRATARKDPEYPQNRLLADEYPLTSIEETQEWVENKLALIEKYWDAKDEDIPECTDKELWKGEEYYKYYSDPNKTERATKANFESNAQAIHYFQIEKQGKGLLKKFGGEVKRCGYCDAVSHCKQAKRAYSE